MESMMFKLERMLLSIKYNTEEKRKLPLYKLSFLELQKKYKIIDDYMYDLETSRVLNEDKSNEDKQIAELDVMLKHHKITSIEYYKQKNDLMKKPWVAIKTNYDEETNPDNLEVEVVYNKTFIDSMKKKGFPGETDEEIVDQWLNAFFISNIDENDLAMMIEDSEERNYQISHNKLNDNSTLIV